MAFLTKVVKVQVPLASFGFKPWEVAGCMVYDQKRNRTAIQTITPATAAALGDDPKGYFDAIWNDTTRVWNIGKRR